jgi:hypothetical protein
MPYPTIRAWFKSDRDDSFFVFPTQITLDYRGSLLFCDGDKFFVCEVQPDHDWRYSPGRCGQGSFTFRIPELDLTGVVEHSGRRLIVTFHNATQLPWQREYGQRPRQYQGDLSHVMQESRAEQGTAAQG